MGGIYLCVPPNQNVGGTCPRVPPSTCNRRPWILDSLGYCVAFFAWSSWLSCFNRTPTLTFSVFLCDSLLSVCQSPWRSTRGNSLQHRKPPCQKPARFIHHVSTQHQHVTDTWRRSDTLSRLLTVLWITHIARKTRLLDVAAQLKRSAHAAMGLAINCAQ